MSNKKIEDLEVFDFLFGVCSDESTSEDRTPDGSLSSIWKKTLLSCPYIVLGPPLESAVWKDFFYEDSKQGSDIF
jgi:hypothetical protein